MPATKPDFDMLYRQMLRSRLFESLAADLWRAGRIPGEMHLGVGEEAIYAGTVTQLEDGDAMALDHRGTAALLMRGADPAALLKEFMGHPEGLCRGAGGHMHLFAPELRAASSGIVGASGPAACGFALAAQMLTPGKLALAFFGEGAMNQGMLLEAFNLAVAWRLPVVFVCKDNARAITTPSPTVTGGDLVARARGFGLQAEAADGNDVEAVWQAAAPAFDGVRRDKGPVFLHFRCRHPEGHMLGDPLLRIVRHPLRELGKILPPLVGAAVRRGGASRWRRTASLTAISSLVSQSALEDRWHRKDPVGRCRRRLKSRPLLVQRIQKEVRDEMQALAAAFGESLRPA